MGFCDHTGSQPDHRKNLPVSVEDGEPAGFGEQLPAQTETRVVQGSSISHQTTSRVWDAASLRAR